MSDNSLYQEARSHLAYLRMAAAAEALPAAAWHEPNLLAGDLVTDVVVPVRLRFDAQQG